MQIQVNTDHNIEGHEKLIHWIETEVIHVLGHFSDHITRVEVHLSDENSDKAGGHDKRCLMEARLAARQPVAVSHHAGSLEEAFSGAAQKLKRALESILGRLKDHHGRESIRGNAVADEPQADQPVITTITTKEM